MQNEQSHGQKFKNRLTLTTSGDFVDTSYLGRDSILPAAKILKKIFKNIYICMWIKKNMKKSHQNNELEEWHLMQTASSAFGSKLRRLSHHSINHCTWKRRSWLPLLSLRKGFGCGVGSRDSGIITSYWINFQFKFRNSVVSGQIFIKTRTHPIVPQLNYRPKDDDKDFSLPVGV